MSKWHSFTQRLFIAQISPFSIAKFPIFDLCAQFDRWRSEMINSSCAVHNCHVWFRFWIFFFPELQIEYRELEVLLNIFPFTILLAKCKIVMIYSETNGWRRNVKKQSEKDFFCFDFFLRRRRIEMNFKLKSIAELFSKESKKKTTKNLFNGN